jgi:hypothetical protein
MIDASFNFRPTRPLAEIMDEYIRTVDYLYEPSKYLARSYHNILAMRPTRAAATGKPPGRSQGNRKDRLPRRQGIVADYRGQFWGQLVGVYRQNPSRLTKYLVQCGMGENLFRIRESLLARASRSGPVNLAPA